MTGYEAETGQIRDAASHVDDAVEVMGELFPGDRVHDIATALPGSDSAIAAGELHTRWNETFPQWHTDAGALAQSLRTGADAYDEADYQAYLEYRRRTRNMVF